MLGAPVVTQCTAPLLYRHCGLASRSQSASGRNRPRSTSACSNVHGHWNISAAKFLRYRSFLIQLSHSLSGQEVPCHRSHCGIKYHASGTGLLHSILQRHPPGKWFYVIENDFRLMRTECLSERRDGIATKRISLFLTGNCFMKNRAAASVAKHKTQNKI